MASGTSVIGSGASGSTWSPAMFSITSLRLNGKNYAPWAKSVEVYFLGKRQLSYLHDDPPDVKDAKFAEWGAEDAQIRIQLWNSMEPQISGSLVYLESAKQVWRQTQELYSGVNNLRRTYDLHQTYFSLSLGEDRKSVV